ncbi:MAG: TetR/AcrR family transcriptional regulator [Halanaerobiales bacterium]|nr:TetR/AcrR family transcriptional regulator [Halanaerobiales bacterium]
MPTETFFNLAKEKKNKVIEISITLFAERGYTKTQITEIVKKADIAKGSFYQYFDDKSDLYKYILNKAIKVKEEYIKKELKKLEEERNFFRYWEGLNKANINFALENINLARVLRDVYKMGKNELFEAIEKDYEKQGIDLIKKWLIIAIKNNEIKSNINIKYTAHLLYTANCFIIDYLLEDEEIDSQNKIYPYANKIVEIIRNGLKNSRKKEG